jgi:hypothetical protein
MARPKASEAEIVARFWSCVEPMMDDRGCWEWTGSRLASGGYGRLCLGSNVQVRAHRFSFELHNGPLPEGFLALHTCDNPPCVNPAHLYSGTDADNVHDMFRRNRVPKGYHAKHGSHPMAKLTETQVRDIRSRDYSVKGSRAKVAREFDVTITQVTKILTGVLWKGL